MCDTCGCDQPGSIRYVKPGEKESRHTHMHEHNGVFHTHEHQHEHGHEHEHEHGHDHEHHGHTHSKEINVEISIMQKNDLLAERNRGFFEAKKITAFNLVSSPGSGKTSILERTIRENNKRFNFYVIEGDQQTLLDADRINRTGAPVIQVNTGNGCHLDAQMVNTAVKQLEVPENATVMIENVGNLVCPALFDLGESRRIVIMSVTEGEDKPLKYPNMFQTSHLCLVNKSDLLPYVDFDMEKFREYALRVNNQLKFITISAKTGEGFPEWVEWLGKSVIC
jgi:hydrogenase nickel incorporation protein HypB